MLLRKKIGFPSRNSLSLHRSWVDFLKFGYFHHKMSSKGQKQDGQYNNWLELSLMNLSWAIDRLECDQFWLEVAFFWPRKKLCCHNFLRFFPSFDGPNDGGAFCEYFFCIGYLSYHAHLCIWLLSIRFWKWSGSKTINIKHIQIKWRT